MADVGFLEGPQGRALLEAAQASRGEPLHRRHRALSKTATREQARLVLEQDELRVRAAAKLPFAEALLYERAALEQATPWDVACERATRWPGSSGDTLMDLGAGIGVDALAAAQAGRPVIAFERDPVRAALLGANARACDVAAKIDVRCEDLEAAALDAPLAFLDPDRRPDGDRARDPESFSPPASAWPALLSGVRGAMVKVPPGFDAAPWTQPFEVVSLDGRARERRLFFGAWGPMPARRALALPGGRAIEGDGIQGPAPRAARAGDALLDPDASVHHADLVGDLAARDALRPINRARSYLVAEQPVDASPGTWLRVDALLPFTARAMNAWLRERDIGSLTIRKRGIDARAAQWRKKLKPRGARAGTLVLTCDPDDRWTALGCFDI